MPSPKHRENIKLFNVCQTVNACFKRCKINTYITFLSINEYYLL